MSDTQPSLAIGTVVGGTIGTSGWKRAVKAVANQVSEIRSEYKTPLAVYVVFQIPGEVFRPEFTGIRSGTFSRRESRVVIQVALPDSLEGDQVDFVIKCLREAVEEAERFAVMEALPDTDLTGLKQLVAALPLES